MPNIDAIVARLGRKRHVKLTEEEIATLNPKCADCRRRARYYSRYLGRKFFECEECHATRGPEGLAVLFRF